MSWGERSCGNKPCPIPNECSAETCNVECREYKWDKKTVPDSGPPKMSVKEFREAGYLQELNRQFLHPLGMAMEVHIDDDKNETFGLVWDSRDDPEGYIFDLENSDKERVDRFRVNAASVEVEQASKAETREASLGFLIEPIPLEKENQ